MDLMDLYWYVVLAIGIVAMIIGMGAVLFPARMSSEFGIPTSGGAVGYVVGLGVRDVFIGICFLGLYMTSDLQLSLVLSVALGMVAFSDFSVVMRYGNKKKAAVHLAGGLFAFFFALASYLAL